MTPLPEGASATTIPLKGYFSDVVEKQNRPDRQTERGKRGKRCRAFADRPVAGNQESGEKETPITPRLR